MRPLLVAMLALLALAPAVAAERVGGNGLGAEVAPYSAGGWDIWRVYVSGPSTLTAALTWVASPGGADYDLTLWKPGADLDGVLSQSEILKTSWTRSRSPGESFSHAVTADPKAYVITVEAVSAKLETYYLDVTGHAGQVVRTCHSFSPPATCLWSAQGVKYRP